jgi:PIN domain nuclease of toxin-antitoxin system
MMGVLDASALLAYLHREPGAEHVEGRIAEFCISSVNWSEVVQKSLAKGVDVSQMIKFLRELELTIEPFTAKQAETSAQLWPMTQELGLSLADRACLALALDKSLPVLTADRIWKQLKLDLDIQVVR